MSKLIGWAVGVAGTIVAVTIAFPSVQPVDVLAGLGVFSIAAGLAFQDILSNLLAGLLLIFRQPFVSRDQIAVGDHEGTVEEISIRETSIRTYDGVRVIIPNTEVYQSAIQIQTAFSSRRTARNTVDTSTASSSAARARLPPRTRASTRERSEYSSRYCIGALLNCATAHFDCIGATINCPEKPANGRQRRGNERCGRCGNYCGSA